MSPTDPEDHEDFDAVDARIRDAFAAVSLPEDRIDAVCPEPEAPPGRSTWSGWALAAATLLTLGLVGGATLGPWFASGSGLVLPSEPKPSPIETPSEWTFTLDPLDRSFEVGDVVQIYSYDAVGWDHGVQRITAIEGDRATVSIIDPDGWNGPLQEHVRLARLDGPLRIMRAPLLLQQVGLGAVEVDGVPHPLEILVATQTAMTVRFERSLGAAAQFHESVAYTPPFHERLEFSPNVHEGRCWPGDPSWTGQTLQVYDGNTGMALAVNPTLSGVGSVGGCLSWVTFRTPIELGSRSLVVTGSSSDHPFADPLIAARIEGDVGVGDRVELSAGTEGTSAPIARGSVVRTVWTGAPDRRAESDADGPASDSAVQIAHVHVSRLDAPAVIRAGTVTARPVQAEALGNKGCGGGPCAP